ncbi:hypothetical protein CSO71_06265 [Salmonella enterica subsp. enterica serovar Infantis]|nr:hypothetical protein [Salmonella enterica subsp. enterica serovar Infantis]
MSWQTHTVFNQPAPLNNSNLFLSDGALCEAVSREGAGWDSDLLASIGQQLGTAESLELGRLANAHPPELLRYDPQGQRLDDVRFHPAWHLLMQGLCANRVHNLAWEEEARAGSFVARAARFVLHAQVEAGTLCPVTMTFAATPLLLQMLPTTFHDWLARAWEQRREAKEALWARLFTPAAKFAICKQGIPFVAEAMEVLGGMGYCEESELPRLYREMPVNSIWEGSGNIMCLDVLRVLTKQHGVYDVLSEAFAEVKGQDRHYDRAVRQRQQRLRKPDEAMGREITQQLFLLGCGAEMLRHASPPLAQAWCQMMLDTRGEMPLPAQVQNDLLLRATGGLR